MRNQWGGGRSVPLQILWIAGPYFELAAHSTPVCIPVLVLVALLEIDEARLSAAAPVGPLTTHLAVVGDFPGSSGEVH